MSDQCPVYLRSLQNLCAARLTIGANRAGPKLDAGAVATMLCAPLGACIPGQWIFRVAYTMQRSGCDEWNCELSFLPWQGLASGPSTYCRDHRKRSDQGGMKQPPHSGFGSLLYSQRWTRYFHRGRGNNASSQDRANSTRRSAIQNSGAAWDHSDWERTV